MYHKELDAQVLAATFRQSKANFIERIETLYETSTATGQAYLLESERAAKIYFNSMSQVASEAYQNSRVYLDKLQATIKPYLYNNSK